MDNYTRYLEISLDQISPVLLSDISKQKFIKLAECMPDIFAHFLSGFEKRLLDDNEEMDYFVSMHNGQSSFYNFISVFDFPGMADYAGRNAAWQRLNEFAAVWTDKSSSVAGINMISLEFDFDSFDDEIIVPSVFFGLPPLSFWKSSDYPDELFRRTDVFINSIGMLTGKMMDPVVKEHIIEITRKSVDKFYIFQAGLMLSRDDAPIRICLNSFNVKRLMDAVIEFFPGSNTITEMSEILKNYGGLFDSFALDLDVTGSGVVKAGIECYFNNKRQPPNEKRWAEVFELLCRDGFCKKEISDNLLVSHKKYMLNKDNAPYGLKNIPNFYAQGLHHIKFTAGVENKSFAKTYLWSGFNWS